MSPRNSGLLLHRSLSPLFHIWEIIIWKLLYILIRTTYLKTFGGFFFFPSAVSINIPSNSLTVWKTGIRHVVWFTSLCSSSAHAYAVNCSQVCQQRTTSSDEEGHKMWLKTFKLLSGSCDYVKLLFQGLEWIFKLRENDSMKCRHFLPPFKPTLKDRNATPTLDGVLLPSWQNICLYKTALTHTKI